MIALMPIATGQCVHADVINGIKKQSVPCSVIICSAPGEVNSQGNYSEKRTAGEILSRSLCVENARKLSDKFVLSIDRDVVITDSKAVESMIECLNSFLDLGAVALWFGNGYHVNLKCVLFRRKVFSALNFTSHKTGCTCWTVKNQVKNMGFKIRHLDFVKRGFEIIYTN